MIRFPVAALTISVCLVVLLFTAGESFGDHVTPRLMPGSNVYCDYDMINEGPHAVIALNECMAGELRRLQNENARETIAIKKERQKRIAREKRVAKEKLYKERREREQEQARKEEDSVLPSCSNSTNSTLCTITFYDGSKYVGEWKRNRRHGQGTVTYTDGSKYVGEWRNNKRHGQGTFTHSDGSKYVGEWLFDKFHGQGTYTYANGIVHEGIFKNGEFQQLREVEREAEIRELKPRAKQGNADAQFKLGLIYEKAAGVLQNDNPKVKERCKKADRTFECGVERHNRERIAREKQEQEIKKQEHERNAFYWYERASKQGHADAQFKLGLMYEDGKGVPQSDRSAKNWYKRAAKQGHADAKEAADRIAREIQENQEQERIAREKREQKRIAREKLYKERQERIAREKREQKRIAREKREQEQRIAREKREQEREEVSKSQKLEEANDNIRLALDILNYTVSGSKESREEVIVLNAKNCIFQVVTIWGKEKLYVNNIILDTVKLYSMKVNNPLFNQLQNVYYVGFDGDKRVLGNLTSGRMVLAQNADLDRVRKAWGLLFSKACKGASPSEF